MLYLQMQRIQIQNKIKDIGTDSSVSTFQFEIQISHFLRMDQ